MMEGDLFYKVRITPELVDSLMTRDARGRLVTWEAGPEQPDGFRDLIFTVHYDDDLGQRIADLEAEVGRLR